MIKKKIQLAILDDHEIVVKGIKSMLASVRHIDIIETFNSAEEFIDYIDINEVNFSVLLLDYSLPGMNADELIKNIIGYLDTIKIVLLTSFITNDELKGMLELGVNCITLKTSSTNEIVKAIDAAAASQPFLGKEIEEQLKRNPKQNSLLDYITPMEQKVIRLSCEGLTYTEISDLTGLTTNTIKSYRKEIYKKLDIHSLADLVKFAINNKMLLIGTKIKKPN
jgi:DNA-binding NarL/FixJ family response regulator